MSTSRDGGTRGRGRGTTFNTGASRSSPRGTFGAPSTSGRGGFNTNRGMPNSTFRGNGAPAARGRGRGRGRDQASPFTPKPAMGRARSGLGGAPTTGSWAERQEKLKVRREQEKKDAVAQGLMTDPDKAVALADAITLVGTCQGMCSEYEMVLRVNRNEVFPEEKVNGDPNGEPDESRFVKTFKRSEAGAEAQLPSDLRPPTSLKRTCDYLFNDIIGNASFLGKVHHFVWDRTRAIRNDFSIQQLTKLDDIRIAVECYERIARFHIVSLHQLALAEKPYDKYDAQQEREQLDRTLLSLMQYYDDTRGRLENVNEPEFRAYCVIFAITNPVPDLEDSVQAWPRQLTKDKRVQTALEIYAAACETTYKQGPMAPKAKPVTAQQDWQRFWRLVQSRRVSYLTACVSEIFFNLIREIALKSIIRCTRPARRNPDGSIMNNSELSLEAVADVLQYDDPDDLYSFVARWGLEFQSAEDGTMYLDISYVGGAALPEPKVGPTQQKSFLVERKRHGRTLPAIIDGLSVRQATDRGLVVEEEQEDEMEEVEDAQEEEVETEDEETEEEDNDSLFVGTSKSRQEQNQQTPGSAAAPTPSNPFGLPGTPFGSTPFGQPNRVNGATNPFGSSGFGQPSGTSALGKPPTAINPFKSTEAAKNEVDPASATKPAFGAASDLFGKPAAKENPFAGVFKTNTTAAQANVFTPSTTFGLSADNSQAAPKSSFGAASGFGAPSTTGVSASSAPQAAKPQTPSPIKKGPFEEEGSPTSLSPKKQDFSRSKEASKLPSPTKQTSEGPAAPSLFARSETNSKSAPVSQPPQTAAAPTATSSQPTTSQSIPPGAQSPTKRRSSDIHNKPKRPSPLSNSFTATEDSTTRATQHTESDTARAQSPPPPEKTTDELLTEVADIVTFDPAWGVWKQFVDFQVSQIVAKAQKKVEREIEAAELYRSRAIRVLLQLRDSVRKGRLRAKATAMRERTRRRLRESTASNGSGIATMENSVSSLKASAAASQAQANGVSRGNSDLLRQSTARGRQSHLDGQTQAGSKRSASAYGSDLAASTSSPMHKRQKSMSHVDDQGKVTKPTLSNDTNDDILKRSSFLGFSSRDVQQRANTTKSTYFRMKALGLQGRNRGVDLAASRGTKRERSESLDAASMPPPARPSASTAVASSPDAPSVVSARSVRAKTDEEDDILFARLKALRESLHDGEKVIQEAMAREELRRSLNESQSSNESPSLARARAEARLRASRGNSQSRERDVPAYRLRESRFVPREEYHLAEERARQTRASRDNSRVGSPQGSRAPGVSTNIAGAASARNTASILFNSPPKPARPSKPPPGYGAALPSTTTPSFGFGAPSQAPAVQPTVPDPTTRNPFSQSSSFAPSTNGQNPFLQTFGATNATSFDDFPQDNTLPPSQLNGTLARSFGPPSQAAQNPFAQTTQKSQSPPPPNSYMPSQAASEAISLLSDDEEEPHQPGEEEHQSGHGQNAFLDQTTENDIDGAFAGRSKTVSFDQEAASQALVQGAYNYTNNPFAALADGVADGNKEYEEHYEEEGEDDDQQETAPQPDSYQYSDEQEGEYEGDGTPIDEYSDDEAPNGYIDDEASDAGDIEDEDGDIEDEDGDSGAERPADWNSDQDGHWDFSDGDDDEDDDEPRGFAPLNNAYNQRVMQSAPAKDPALQFVGNTQEEAIELSD
ncbi:SAC3 family protein 1 [Fulvia fulva]|uniref:SAC3 family protein 1 n=1 Tax=Passalora fulva TaxID=5499 RepID=A0A9Q8PAF6_PASFU|nr:SAC3 family protein 1 [Fulvia fulva]UJO18853.1 SAC3 family protein 1 [Fulvia fulva]